VINKSRTRKPQKTGSCILLDDCFNCGEKTDLFNMTILLL